MAIAVIAAAVADPIVEFASNAGWFGSGNFTDHSSLDVAPALLAGVVLLALYLVQKARALLSESSDSDCLVAILPAIFVLQLAVLYIMETTEQLVVWRHVLGPTVWLGAPAPIGITLHAAIGAAVAFMLLGSKRRLAKSTLCVLRLIRAIATRSLAAEKPADAHRLGWRRLKESLPVLCSIGERAPPVPVL